MPISRSLKEATEATGRVGPKLIVGGRGDERGIGKTPGAHMSCILRPREAHTLLAPRALSKGTHGHKFICHRL